MISRKVGAHIIGGMAKPLGRPRVVLLFQSSVQYYKDVRALVGPDCTIVARWDFTPNWSRTPEQEAARWWAEYGARALECKFNCTLIQGANEIADSAAPQYVRFERERMRLCHGVGLNVAVGAWAVGTPDLPTWATYQPLLDAMRPLDAVCLHEYWADKADLLDPGHWHFGRFSRPEVWPYLKDKRIVLGELGRDYIKDINRGWPGWIGHATPDEYLDELRLAGQFLDQYPNVPGAAMFTGGNDPRWAKFAIEPVWSQIVAEYPPEEVTPVAQPLKIDGRSMTVAEFKAYVEAADLGRIERVVIHHTAFPAEVDWRAVGWDGRKYNMAHYYGVTKKWTEGPHLFVWYDSKGIGLFWDLAKTGRGVGGGPNEEGLRHIETAGNWSTEPMNMDTWANAVAVAAILLHKAGRGVEGLTHHQAIVGPGATACPGTGMIQRWPQFLSDVADTLEALYPPPAPEPKGLTAAQTDEVLQDLEATRAKIARFRA